MPVWRRVASDNLFLIVHKKKKTARVASHSYNTLKEKNVRGDSPPCGFTPAQVIILITLLKKKTPVREASPLEQL